MTDKELKTKLINIFNDNDIRLSQAGRCMAELILSIDEEEKKRNDR